MNNRPLLTTRQEAILAVVRGYYYERGYPASIREIAAAAGLASGASVHRQLHVLASRGLVVRVHAGHRCWLPTEEAR